MYKIFEKVAPNTLSVAVLSAIYYTSFELFAKEFDSDWIFMYRLVQSLMVTHLISFSHISQNYYNNNVTSGEEGNPSNDGDMYNLLSYVGYVTSTIAFYTAVTVVLFHPDFATMRNEQDFKIIEKIYYGTLSTGVKSYILFGMKNSAQTVAKMLSYQ